MQKFDVILREMGSAVRCTLVGGQVVVKLWARCTTVVWSARIGGDFPVQSYSSTISIANGITFSCTVDLVKVYSKTLKTHIIKFSIFEIYKTFSKVISF